MRVLILPQVLIDVRKGSKHSRPKSRHAFGKQQETLQTKLFQLKLQQFNSIGATENISIFFLSGIFRLGSWSSYA